MIKIFIKYFSSILNLKIFEKILEKAGYEKEKKFVFFLYKIRDFYQYLKKKPSVIYAGAHNGSAALKINEILNYDKIYLFEPNQMLCKQIENKSIPNSVLINKAIDNQDMNNVEFNIASKDSISSLKELNTDSSWYKLRNKQFNKNQTDFVEQIKVNVTKLSTFINNENIKNAEILIIDTQGNTLNVLKSCENYLKLSYFDFIIAEIIFDNCYGSKEKIMDIESYLDNFGYGTIGLHSQSSLFEDCGQVDIIYGSNNVVLDIENQKIQKIEKIQ